MTLNEKLNRLSSGKRSNWLQKAEEKLAYAGARRNARNIALRVLQLLREQRMTQTDLAEKMGVSRQQITKIVKGEENFTLETIDKLEQALQTTLMTVHSPATTKEPLRQSRSYNAILSVTKDDLRLLTELIGRRDADANRTASVTYTSPNFETIISGRE
jgi:transcriptional regulator with XRE-family HTH domain